MKDGGPTPDEMQQKIDFLLGILSQKDRLTELAIEAVGALADSQSSLRDAAALAALQGILANSLMMEAAAVDDGDIQEQIAQAAFRQADAFIAERERREKE